MVPRTRLELVRFSPHAPQTCAATNYATSAWEKFQKVYFFAVFGAFAFVAAFVFALAFIFALTLVLVAVLALTGALTAAFVFGDSTARFVAGGTLALAFEFMLKSVIGGCVVSVCDSEVVCKTETLPFNAGIASKRAVSINVVAAPIVIFDKIVAVPRGPKAALETLLVNSAPASVLPG